jgi:hypothetical protein
MNLNLKRAGTNFAYFGRGCLAAAGVFTNATVRLVPNVIADFVPRSLFRRSNNLTFLKT